MQLAEAGREPPPLSRRGTPSAPDDLSMAEAGAILIDESPPVSAPDIDTNHLSLSEPGVDMVETAPVEAPEYDLSELELAPPGEPLGGGPVRR